MNLSDLQIKEVIDITSGKRLGNIIDIVITQDGNIKKLILEDRKLGKRFLSTSKEEIYIEWKQIIKIGDDILLVKSDNTNKYSYLP